MDFTAPTTVVKDGGVVPASVIKCAGSNIFLNIFANIFPEKKQDLYHVQ